MTRGPAAALAAIAALLGASAARCLAESPAAPKAETAKHAILIGTNRISSVYYEVGNAICRLVGQEESKRTDGPRVQPCGPAISKGSVTNVEALRNDTVDLALVQSNLLADAAAGAGLFKDRPNEKLRVLFSLYDEPFQLLVLRRLGIKSFEELKDRKVNIGTPNSGANQSFMELMRLHGLTLGSFSKTSQLSEAERFNAFCDGDVEAFGMIVGYPNAGFTTAISKCGGDLLSLDTQKDRSLIEGNRYYRADTIPKGTYPGVDRDISTFGVVTVAVATSDMPDEVAYRIVRDVFERLEDFKAMHPALAKLDATRMVKDGITVPLHPGAIRYFKEKGLM